MFASIQDPRDGGNTRHHFGEILFIAFAAALCGVRSYELMEEFAELRETWLRKWLKLPNSIPCSNTFSRVVQAIEPTAFAECIATHLGRLGFEMQGGQIAIDGKALRGNRMPCEGQKTKNPPETETPSHPRSRIPRTAPLPSVGTHPSFLTPPCRPFKTYPPKHFLSRPRQKMFGPCAS